MSQLWQERLVNPAYHYQLDLIWRIICQGNTLGQIPVGGGKTAIMVVASQLLRQFGKCTKPAMVVPDHLVLQQAAEALAIYPGLKVLLIASELMNTNQKRRELINCCASGNWDLIICSQTAFASIPLHPDTVGRFQEAEFETLMAGWHESYGGDTSSRRGLKDEERATERYRAKVEARHAKLRRAAVAYFDHTGIDWLLVDESHDYLGLPTDTRITGVLGLGSSNSQRAQDLRYKTQFLAGLRGEGQGLVLMSGTPIRNTLGQAWVNLVYLMPHVLKGQSLLHFDSFISVFAEAVTQTEVTGAGTLDVKTRLASWSNLPEFRLLWRQVAHIIRDDQLQIVRPKPVYKTVEVSATPSQIEFFNWLAARVVKIKQHRGRPQKGDDNWCAVCSDTTMGVVDVRLLRRHKLGQFLDEKQLAGLDREYSKVERCIDDTYQSWADPTNTEMRRVQLIFCDTGTPHGSGRWTVYGHIKLRLVEQGVPETEIAFIHDAKDDKAKAELFERARQGKVRVLVASTAKLGVGTQIPDRLYQLRHLDCPKRPTDIWQRNGRIVRPGNLHSEVEIYFYVTTGKPVQMTDKDGKNTTVQGISPDSWLYELVRRKASFIDAGVNSENNSTRTIEDIDEVTLDFATLMATATGDRRLIEKMNLDRQVQVLLDLESDYQVRRSIAQRQVNLLPDAISRLEAQIKAACTNKLITWIGLLA
ncbi:MAG: helicase-related protein [Nodosilinea sp.]